MKRILAASALVALAAFATFPAIAATTTTTTTKTVTAKAPVTVKAPVKAAPVKVAATTPAKPVVLTFKLIDANHDGKISFEELKKYFAKLTKDEFAKVDADKSGFLNKTELAAFVKSQQPPKAPMAMTMTKAK